MVITNGHAMVLQTMADLKQKHKKALADRQEQARVRQQGVDTQLAEKGKALAVAQQDLKDTKAASEQASQVCHSFLDAPCAPLHFLHARLPLSAAVFTFLSLCIVSVGHRA